MAVAHLGTKALSAYCLLSLPVINISFEHQELFPWRVFNGSFIDVGFPPQLSHWVGKLFVYGF